MKKIKIINIGAVDLFDTKTTNNDLSFRFLSLNDVENKLKEDGGKLIFQKRTQLSNILPDYVFLSHLDFDVGRSEKIISLLLKSSTKDYTFIYDKSSISNVGCISQLEKNGAIGIEFTDSDSFTNYLSKFFFAGQEGAKLSVNNTDSLITKDNELSIKGNTSVDFNVDFGTEFQQIHSWRYNYVFQENKVIEVWLEYDAEDTVEIMLCLTRISENGQEIIQTIKLFGKNLRSPYIVKNFNPGEYLFCSVFAKGRGQIKIGQLHIRRSRENFGTFFIGGERIVGQNRQEIMTYFHPGDRKPPLNVYFSGYRSAEGFEGNFMMRNLEAPYLLITDPRIEGGGFYIGEHSIELNIVQTINQTLAQLGFNNRELIMSGLSMGTYGALYYAAELEPHAVIVGKPLVNIGNVAYNEHTIRPNQFPTSLDVLYNITGGNTEKHRDQLNERFWKKFIKGNYANTKFNIAFMKNDDYDPTAFYDIRKIFADKDIMLLSKGFVGRHNDNSYAINMWFLKQYHNILRYDFKRSGNYK